MKNEFRLIFKTELLISIISIQKGLPYNVGSALRVATEFKFGRILFFAVEAADFF